MNPGKDTKTLTYCISVTVLTASVTVALMYAGHTIARGVLPPLTELLTTTALAAAGAAATTLFFKDAD